MELEQILNKRRTHRFFNDQPVDRQIVDQLIKAAVKAPVACNLQISKFIVVDNKDILQKLSKLVSYKFTYTPCMIVVLHDSRFTVKRHSGLFSTAMAVENIVLRATDLGLATIAMSGFTKDRIIKQILDIPGYFEIDLLLAVGYSDKLIQPRQIPKIDLEDVYQFNSGKKIPTIREDNDLDQHSIASIIDYRRRISPVYLDRFRLHTYKSKYYEQVVDFFYNNIIGQTKDVLDVMSYDGQFVFNFYKNKKNSEQNLHVTDYLLDNIKYFHEQFGCAYYHINQENNIQTDKKFDLATLIFQVNFTPELDKLLTSIYDSLSDHGSIFVTIVATNKLKVILKNIFEFYKKYFKKEIFNIYENNPYYKIGPIKYMSSSQILSIFKKHGFKINKKGLILKSQAGGITVNYFLFKK